MFVNTCLNEVDSCGFFWNGDLSLLHKISMSSDLQHADLCTFIIKVTKIKIVHGTLVV